jgi:FkbM family methyltransferase
MLQESCGVSFNRAPAGDRNDFDDEQIVRERWWHPTVGEHVLDVGAAIGSYALPALARGASVTAFSPDPPNTIALRENLDLNDGFAARCDVLTFGAYSRTGWMALRDGAYVYCSKEPDDDVCFPVRAINDLDLFAHWIKIDVEGAEVEVLRGAERLIRWQRPRLLVECHQFMDRTLHQQVVDFVESLNVGYTVQTVPHHSVLHAFFEVV